MPLDIVKRKYRSISGRQLRYSFIQGDAIYYRHRIGVFGAFYYLDWSLTVFGR